MKEREQEMELRRITEPGANTGTTNNQPISSSCDCCCIFGRELKAIVIDGKLALRCQHLQIHQGCKYTQENKDKALKIAVQKKELCFYTPLGKRRRASPSKPRSPKCFRKPDPPFHYK